MENDLDAVLKQLPQLMKKKEESLEKREKELQRLKASLEEEYPSLGKPGDVLRLNIGGSCISVLRRTLTQVDGSMLAAKFSGRWDDSQDKDEDGRFFIDQPIGQFLLMIDHLRAMATESSLAGLPKPPYFTEDDRGNKERKDFFRMVDYYGVTPGIYPMGLYCVDQEGGRTLVASHPNYEVENQELTTYCLLPMQDPNSNDLHTRRVKSFEITVGRHNTAQVGWTCWDYRAEHLFSRSQDGGQGAGYGDYTIAFDLVRCGMVCEGQYQAVSNEFTGDGRAIRCEAQGNRWHVDGVDRKSVV